MENIDKFSYEVQNRKVELTIMPGANPNGLYAIIIIAQEGTKYIGTVRFTINWLDFLKHLNSWKPFIDAAYKLFIHRNCAERLFALKQISTINCDIDEEFKFLE